MPGAQPFIRVANVTLNAAGYGFCTITVPSGVKYRVDLTTVSTNVPPFPVVVQPVCKIYRDSSPSPSHFVEQTFTGNGNSSNTVHNVTGGDAITAEWTGGTAGSVATLRISGLQVEGF